MAEASIPDQNTVVCFFKIDENHHVRSGVVFTPEVRMKHVDRCWKAYPTGNKGESPEFECGEAKYQWLFEKEMCFYQYGQIQELHA